MIRDVQLHDIAPQCRERFGLGLDLHASFDRSRARGGKAFASFDFYQAHATGAKRLQTVGRAQLGNIDARLTCGAQDARAGLDRCRQAVDFYFDGFGIVDSRRAKIGLSDFIHLSAPCEDAKSSAKYFRTLLTG